MNTELDTQLREFGTALEQSLPEIDVDDIRHRVQDVPSRRRFVRSLPTSLVAPAAALLVLIVAAPALWLASDRGSEPTSVSSVALGTTYVWPEGDFRGGGSAEIAREFAAQVLGWNDAVVAPDPRGDIGQASWTIVRNAEGRELELLSVFLGPDRWAVVQVGPVGVLVDWWGSEGLARIGLSSIADAVRADLHVRYEGTNQVETVEATRSDLERGWVEIDTPSSIASALVIYFDEGGIAVTAEAGSLGPTEKSVAITRDGSGGDYIFSPSIPLAMPSRRGDATDRQLRLLVEFSKGTQPGNEVDMEQLFVPDGFVDTALRGRWEGSEAIEERSEVSASSFNVAEMMGFTAVDGRLFFNWTVFSPGGLDTQGVEATFEDDLLAGIEVTSLALPYCIGGVETGCKDYDTGEIHPQDLSLPVCQWDSPIPCRLP